MEPLEKGRVDLSHKTSGNGHLDHTSGEISSLKIQQPDLSTILKNKAILPFTENWTLLTLHFGQMSS